MREITKLMIIKYQLLNLKFDFMGYEFENENDLSFHHLIVPHRACKRMKNEGFTENNGAIIEKQAHNYLHLIENYDRDIYDYITAEMVVQNLKGHLDMDNIKNIDRLLCIFEKENDGKTTKGGQPLVRDEYKKRILRRQR